MYGCPILTSIQYKDVKIGHYIHWKVCEYYGILDCEKWYKLQLEAKKTTILWNFAIQTDRKIK